MSEQRRPFINRHMSSNGGVGIDGENDVDSSSFVVDDDDDDDDDAASVEEVDNDEESEDVDNEEAEEDADGVFDNDDDVDDDDEEDGVKSVSVVSLKSVGDVKSVMKLVVVFGEASWQHSRKAGSHGMPNVNLLKAHPWPIDPVRIPNLHPSQQSRW